MSTPTGVWVVSGDIFASRAQTIGNPINTAGVMGAGLAKEFARRYPEMYADYKLRCRAGAVRVGEPYLWRGPQLPWVLNFPTKRHWREASRVEDVVAGLRHLKEHVDEWGIETLAVPALGCGLGGLDFAQMEPVLRDGLSDLGIAVKLYRPS